MRFKIDENLPAEAATLLREGGFDADTVAEEGMSGAADATLAEVAQSENRVIVTLDQDFGNIQRFPPNRQARLVVLKPKLQDKKTVITLLSRLIPVLRGRSPDRELWIVEPDRIRIRAG